MANLKFKYLIIMVVLLLIPLLAYADDISQSITVCFNKINIEVNGTKVTGDNILYNGTTYVPLRAVLEMLGKSVEWKAETNTASITDKPVEAAYYVGSKESNKYHKPDCRFAAKISEDNLIIFKTKEEAKRKGYEACETCKP